MAGVVGRWAAEAREGEVPGVGRCYCECCGGRPKPIIAGYQSCCASEANLHDELGPEHQNGILLFGRERNRSAPARWFDGSRLWAGARAFGESRPIASSVCETRP